MTMRRWRCGVGGAAMTVRGLRYGGVAALAKARERVSDEKARKCAWASVEDIELMRGRAYGSTRRDKSYKA